MKLQGSLELLNGHFSMLLESLSWTWVSTTFTVILINWMLQKTDFNICRINRRMVVTFTCTRVFSSSTITEYTKYEASLRHIVCRHSKMNNSSSHTLDSGTKRKSPVKSKIFETSPLVSPKS